ncbi:hypothetical protein J437_LFUL002235 [Ladona fulva]|uniref:Acyltransferase 3 domain-containing protein n=1 Tax=Ladona fulva TaxID=123851 RepID=A0A8K0JZU1_LADFU|nr:hypothetical protein J437_LFUL002235 [Ladona fulva]
MVLIISTAYDMLVFRQRDNKEDKPTRTESFLLIFSAYTNLEKLGRPDRTKEMSILHGLRLFSMVFIILGHRCLFSYGGPFYNPEFLEERYRKIQDMFLLNGTLIVDTFFVLSGFLTCYTIILELTKRKGLNIGMLYLYRWMRLTPVYMMVVAFYATLIDNLDNGPMWKAKMGVERERCQQNWWTNFLYINNYVNADQLCMFQSWYIACDMHYFLIAPLIIFPLWRWKNWKGKIPLATVVIASIIIPFIITFVGKYDGVLRVYISLLEDPNANEHYRNVYIKSHSRAGPYFIGITAAYICYQRKIAGKKFSKLTMWIVSLIAAFVGLASMFGGWSFYIPGRPYYIWENATYATLHRIAWSMAMCWAILGSITTGFNVLEPILSLDAITPLSRLTYCVFLTHGAVQLYIVSSLRVPQFMSFPRLFWMASGDLVMAFIFALFIHLLFEAPVGGLQKILLSSGKQRRPRQAVKSNEKNEETNGELREIPNTNGNVNPAYNSDSPAETQEV